MKKRMVLLLGLMSCVFAFGQNYKVFRKDGCSTKIQAIEVDSMVQDGKRNILTLHMKNGDKNSYDKAEVDSVVCYDPAASLIGILKRRGNYNFFLRLLQDVGMGQEGLGDHLEGAGGASLFVADDEGWNRFFTDNAQRPAMDKWHNAISYESLTEEQKHELLSCTITESDKVPNSLGDKMASNRLYKPTLVTQLKANEMPYSNSPTDKDFYKPFRMTGRSITLSNDIGDGRITFFTPENMRFNHITESDLLIILPNATDHMAGDRQMTESGIQASNGKLNTTHTPLIFKGSMADVIRTNGKTNIFSHILDRFSAPYYNEEATLAYRKLHPEFTDSVFTIRYLSQNSFGHTSNDTLPDGTQPDGWIPLKYDPAWIGLCEYEGNKERDMASMFVPSDEAMWKYFTTGLGQQLIQTYYTKEGSMEEIPYTRPTTQEELFCQIDSIPRETLRYLITSIMFRSFTSSVPSKMTKLRNDSQKQMFYREDIEKIDTCILSDNGAVYIMDEVYGPSLFTSITGSAYLSENNRIMRWAIYDQEYMDLNYNVYLEDRSQNTLLFLPNDSAMQYCYDPISVKSSICSRVISMSYTNKRYKINSTTYSYNKNTGTIGKRLTGSNATLRENEITNRLRNILESHTVCDNWSSGSNEYLQTKNGNVVRLVRDSSGKIVGAQGTMQIENERNGLTGDTPGLTLCKVSSPYHARNGMTFCLDAPLIPTYRSLWSILTDDLIDGNNTLNDNTEDAWRANPFRAFYELCNPMDADAEPLIRGCGLVDENLTMEEQETAMKRYRVFISDKGLDLNFGPLKGSTPFTAYIPTNEAVEAAIARGDIPTWEDIKDDYVSHCNGAGNLQSSEDSLRIQGKIARLTDIVLSHFYFGIAIADNESKSLTQKSVHISHENGLQNTVDVQSGYGQISLTDRKSGKTYQVTNAKNRFFCDYTCSRSPLGSMSGITIDSQRPGVIHQIDGVMGLE